MYIIFINIYIHLKQGEIKAHDGEATINSEMIAEARTIAYSTVIPNLDLNPTRTNTI